MGGFPPAGFDPVIADYYERSPEEDRLQAGPFRIEAARTLELIERFAPRPPAALLDVGGGAGAYAHPLAAQGYEVHLVDASPRLVEVARRRGEAGDAPLRSCEVGDARSLRFPDASAAVVLLLGPLYHLPEAADRARALAEARRVLVPGGRLFAAGISRFASLLGGLALGQLSDPAFAAIVEQDLRDGRHRNPETRLDWFTTAFLHRPEDLEHEVRAAGFRIDGLFGLEGLGWLLPDVEERMRDAARSAEVLRAARAVESEPSLRGLSAHFVAVATKPD